MEACRSRTSLSMPSKWSFSKVQSTSRYLFYTAMLHLRKPTASVRPVIWFHDQVTYFNMSNSATTFRLIAPFFSPAFPVLVALASLHLVLRLDESYLPGAQTAIPGIFVIPFRGLRPVQHKSHGAIVRSRFFLFIQVPGDGQRILRPKLQ